MRIALLFLAATVCLTSNIRAGEPRPPGVSRRILFNVTPLYPNSFEITAAGPRSFTAAKLKEAWEKKAQMVAKGRRYQTSPVVVHDNETVTGTYWPLQSRSLTATITPY